MSDSGAAKNELNYINGKGQIIEMLKYMNPAEKKTLLKNIRHRNPSLALELSEKSFSFKNLESFSDHSLQLLLNYLQAPILGIALKASSIEFQRKMLQLADRDYAEKAYSTLMTPVPNEQQALKRAQEKVLSTIMVLTRRGQIELN